MENLIPPLGYRRRYPAFRFWAEMKRYFQLVRQFLGAGAQFGFLLGGLTAFTTNWKFGVLSGAFSWALISLWLPLILLMLERGKRGPIKLQFRIRTILLLFGLIAFVLASWQWTNTYGVRQLGVQYEANAREIIHRQVEEYNLRDTDDEILDKVDFFANPHAILPFVITVEFDDAYKIHYSVKSSARTSATHVWFLGYVSEPLSKLDIISIFVAICALVVGILIPWSISFRKQRCVTTVSETA